MLFSRQVPSFPHSATPPNPLHMTATERRSAASLASIFALRMLGLFLVLPVFALEAAKYPGGHDTSAVGLAMGIYGLTQGLLQIPFGLASDRFGRKRVIVLGLLVFALGSFWAAAADSLLGLVAGRALQGAGAVSAAVTALLADQTRDEVRTKAMAMVGASIGLMFALSLVLAPLLVTWVGLHGLFALTGALALLGMAVVTWWTPAQPQTKPQTEPHAPSPAPGRSQPRPPWRSVLAHAGLQRLNLGVFVLHAVQLAMWVAVPALLVQAGLPKAAHWQLYLPVVLASFVVMGSTLFQLEARGYLRALFLLSIGLIGLVQLGLLLVAGQPALWALALLLFVFFCGFNVLEASQPSLVSRLAPAPMRGAALGVYNSLQSLGFFVGGALGGWLLEHWGMGSLFAACAALMALWLLLAWPMQAPQRSRRPESA
jgi:MFS family permease